MAASPPQAIRTPDADIQSVISQADMQLHDAGAGFRTSSLSDIEIKQRLAEIDALEPRLTTVLAEISTRLHDVQARQAQLGPAPPKTVREDRRTEEMRRRFDHAVSILSDDQHQVQVMQVEGEQISDVLTERLKTNFDNRLYSQSRSLLDPELWRMFAAEASSDIDRVADALADQSDAYNQNSAANAQVTLLAAGLVCFLILGPLRVLGLALGLRRAGRDEAHSPLTRSWLALWRVLVGTATPLLAGLLFRAALQNAQAVSDVGDTVMALLVRTVTFAAFIDSLGRAVLSPGHGEWRLAPIPDDLARRLAVFPTLIGASTALGAFFGGFDAAVGVSLASQVIVDNITTALQILVVGGGLVAVGHARLAQLAAAEAQGESRLPWVLAALAGWLSVVVAIGADLSGYLAFASFVVREAVWVGAILALIFLVIRLVDDAVPRLLSPDHPLGGALESALALSPEAVEQIAVLITGLARLGLFVFAWIAIVAPFGASAGDIFGRVAPASLILRLGKVTISPSAVLGALALFFVGLLFTRAVRQWLERRYLPKTQLDIGVRASLTIGVSYLGATAAIVVAFASLGLSLSQITLFASALSVGIGFGLQSIIGNFVSGLILLAERPVRVGDWVAIGDLEGDVRKISVRATEIEMADRSRLIVPNSELVTKTVRNVTHVAATGRVRIVLKVAAATDPMRVRDLLMARLSAHKDLLKQPAPGVFLTNLVDGALEFTSIAYVRSPRDAFRVKSELLFQIVPDLRAEGIELSSSSPVVNLGLGERLIEPDERPARTPRAPRRRRDA